MSYQKGWLEDASGNQIAAHSLATEIVTSDSSTVQAKLDSIPTTYATKTELSQLSAGIVQVVASRPASGTEGVIYLVETSTQNVYDKYTWENSTWVSLGSTSIDLSNYVQKDSAVASLSLSDHTLTVNLADGTSSTITLPDDDTTYSAGTGLDLTGTTFSLPNSGATAGSYGESANATLTYGGTFKVLSETVDAQGRVTAVAEKTLTMPASDNTVGIPVVESNGTAPTNLVSGGLFFRKDASA